jgi:putative GTP pyrophosphokinase
MSDFPQLFKELRPKYTRLADNVAQALVQFLEEKKISSFDVEKRVKEEKSFLDKIVRKSYTDPLDQIEDIVGVRVICYYNEDLALIDEIIKTQFSVISHSNKHQELEADQFGYTSNHYIIKLKSEWLQTPNYRGLEDLKVEIQVRTILMHAWAAISHKLLYKRQEDIPKEFKRKLNRLSALIELADEQFDDIKNIKIEYQSNFVVSESTSINADSFLALMHKYFPERNTSDSQIPSILAELREHSGSLVDFESRIKRCISILAKMEQEENPKESLPVWGVSGVARTILDLTNDDYWQNRELPEPFKSVTEHYRNLI